MNDRKKEQTKMFRRVINIVKRMHEIYKELDRTLDEVTAWRREINEHFWEFPEAKIALRKLDMIEKKALASKKELESNRKGFLTMHEIIMYIFALRKIRKYKGKSVYIWIDDDDNVHFEFKDGYIVITPSGRIIAL